MIKITQQSAKVHIIKDWPGETIFLPKTGFLLKTFFSKTKSCLTQKIYLWKLRLRQKKRLTTDLALDHTGGWRGHIKHNDNDWKFQKYKGAYLDYD